MAGILAGAEPFLLQGGRRGVLLIHGFTGSPSEMLLLGEHLNACGYTVFAPRLSGHGTSPEEMAGTNWVNWYHSVCDGYHILKHLCDSICVVGLSMGGLLAIRMGIEFAVGKIAVLSAPIYIADRNIRLLPPPEKTIGRYVLKKRRSIPALPDKYNVAYRRMPLPCVHDLLELIKNSRRALKNLDKPLLIIQSKNDRTVVANSAEYIYKHCASEEKELFWLEKSGHMVVLDLERELVFRKIAEFIG